MPCGTAVICVHCRTILGAMAIFPRVPVNSLMLG
jgi:hypothetical protein